MDLEQLTKLGPSSLSQKSVIVLSVVGNLI